MQDFSISNTELIFYKMQALQLLAILLCSISLCKRTTAIGTHTTDEAAEFPARATCPDTWFVPSCSGECQCGHTFHGVVSCDEDDDKTFLKGGSSVKFAKVFTRKSFQLYGHSGCVYVNV